MNSHYKYTYTYNGMRFDPEVIDANYQYQLTVLSDQVELQLRDCEQFPQIQQLLQKICDN